MNIRGELNHSSGPLSVISVWDYNPDDPWAVSVSFVGTEVEWLFSLELLWETFTSPSEELHGYGDVQLEVSGEDTFILLRNEFQSATLKFPTAEIQEFLNQVDERGSEETVAMELDEFLETL